MQSINNIIRLSFVYTCRASRAASALSLRTSLASRPVFFSFLGLGVLAVQAKRKELPGIPIARCLFEPSMPRSQHFKPTYPTKDLSSLAGYEEVFDRVADIVSYLQDPAEYTKGGASAPKGIILSGPPGVGKTHLAEAVAGHAGVSFILVSAAEFQKPYVGQTEELLRNLFKTAAESAPCVICIDEIESIASRRIDSESNAVHAHYINAAVNQLLSLLSQDRPGVVVIATTNKYETLDEAVVRPGRFDRNIVVPLPNLKERKQILELHAKNKTLIPKLSLADVAALTSGFSGAQLSSLINEAAVCATREKSPQITEQHLDSALSLLQYGVARPNNSSREEKVFTAAHEAGHALVGHLLNSNLYKVSVCQHGDNLGFTSWIEQDSVSVSEQELLNRICRALAGRAAEELLFGTRRTGNSHDIKWAKHLANMMVKEEGMGNTILGSEGDVDTILQNQLARAKKLLMENQAVLLRIRDTLVDHDELLRSDFLKVIAGEKIAKRAPKPALLPLPKKAPQREIKPVMMIEPTLRAGISATKEDVAKALSLDSALVKDVYYHPEGSYHIFLKAEGKKLPYWVEYSRGVLEAHGIDTLLLKDAEEMIIIPVNQVQLFEKLIITNRGK